MPKKSGKQSAAKPGPKSKSVSKPAPKPAKLSNIWQLTRAAALTLWQHKELFGGITLVYGLLNIILAQGLSGASDTSALKQTLTQVSKGHFGALGSGLRGFGLLLTSSNGSSSTSSGYQAFLLMTASLAIIWALRQVLTGPKPGPRVRDSYYKGMYPLVPFILVLFVIGLQLIPLLIGSAAYGLVLNNGIAIHFIEKLIWTVIFGLLAAASFYMLSSSLFALYIVTLPDMTPLTALRSARDLVRHRRWTALRKILGLPLMLLIAAGIVMVPIIIWLTPASKWVFFVLGIAALPAAHAYMYTLYRELLNE